MVSGNFTLNLWFPFWGPGHSICRAQVKTTLGFPSDSKNWSFKKGLTNARHRGFELQSSDLWGSKNDLSVQKVGCACYKMQYIIQIIQKLGHHVSNLYFVTLWVKRILSMDSLNLGETWLWDKKSRNLVEWDRFRF